MTDDTVAAQAWLDSLVNGTEGFCETGVYRITQPLVFTGNPSSGVRITGPVGLSRGPGGCWIKYDGPPGQAVLYLNGVNGTLIDNMTFDGNGKALYALQIDNSGGRSSSGVQVDHSWFGQVAGAGAIAVAVGHVGCVSEQVSEVSISNSYLQSAVPGQGEGFKTLCANNVKNFILDHDSFNGWSVGVDWSNGSGTMRLDGPVFANSTSTDIMTSVGFLTITGGESEGTNYRFIVGDCSNNGGATNVIGFSWQGSAPDDDMIVRLNCQLNLIGNDFRNWRTSSSVPKIGGGSGLVDSADNFPGVYSAGNFYQRAVGFAPITDWQGRQVTDLTEYPFFGGRGKPPGVISDGDQGGDGGSRVPLRSVHGLVGDVVVGRIYRYHSTRARSSAMIHEP